jgi:hypothetical protein
MDLEKRNALATAKTAIEDLAKSLKIAIQYHRLDGFAGACYNDNSVHELVSAVRQKSADHIDCEEWKISPIEWRCAIRSALENRLYTDLCEIEKIRNS